MRVVFIVTLLFACGEDPAPTRVWTPDDHAQPPAPDQSPNAPQRTERSGNPRARAAAALWNVSCASCHGRDGRGDGPDAPTQLASFRRAEWQAANSDEEIARVITLGRDRMPNFGDQIAAAGIAALVEHVRTLGSDGDTETDAESHSESDAESDTESDSETDTESDSETDAESESESPN